MSTTPKAEGDGAVQEKRMQANARIIWGNHTNYDIDLETNDWV